MNPLLRQIADYYSRKSTASLAGLCFVFPNKRSATFFRYYLRRAVVSDRPWIEPEFIDMARFVSSFSTLQEATRYESLFTLFRCYRAINGSDADMTFDRFLFWGEMLISDFNDVDRYLVDADTLFTNLERLKEIGSTYLTPEQIEIIKRYWGSDDIGQREATDRFWTHLNRKNSLAGNRFKKLWEVLGTLYHSYIGTLESNGLTTRGRLYRLAACNAVDAGGDAAGRRYVFVGFNVLTTSELKIFRRLKAAGRADFFWDFNSPALRTEVNKAGRFIRRNMEEFPPPADFEEEPVVTFPQIEIIGVPSATGQVKMGADVLARWHKEGLIDTSAGGINTAVVLPDENLFIPMIHSMPKSIGEMNVTMGFPMRLSPVSALVGNIRLLQKNARRDAEGRVTGYFHEDVRNLLSMPMVQSLDPVGAARINGEIRRLRLFNVPPAMLCSEGCPFAPVFAPLSRRGGVDEVEGYIKAIITHLSRTAHTTDDRLTIHFLESYEAATDTLCAAMRRFSIDMDAFTFLQLVSRAVRGDTVRFTGEPLRGLQIMGMLETRTLDFDQLIVMSMNEHVFPRKQYQRSFIPDVLRRAYGMATTDFQESIFAYYFYRLISRASKVCLLYDSRAVGGTRSNEMSRYLTQLLYLYPEARCRHLAARFSRNYFASGATSVEKTPEVTDRLLRYTREGSGFTLSASAINTYINCPLLFYLQYVERFNPDDEITDYVDYSTYGSIVHQVMERLYKSLQDEAGNPATVSREFLESVLKDSDTRIDRLICEAVNEIYSLITDPEQMKPLSGETKVLGKVIKRNIRSLLRHELKIAPFTFIAAEKKVTARMKINDSLTVNIKQIIDRIDEIADPDDPGKKLRRIVDYKTGSDPTTAPSVESLFDPASDNRPKAIMQLFFYCYIYAATTGFDDRIQPLIYKMRDIYKDNIDPLTVDAKRYKTYVRDYRDYLDDFLDCFHKVVEEIFNPAIPFRPAVSDHSCKFCNFKSLCSRGE